MSKIEESSITSRSNPEHSKYGRIRRPRGGVTNHLLRLLQELGILRFKNTTVSWTVRARIYVADSGSFKRRDYNENNEHQAWNWNISSGYCFAQSQSVQRCRNTSRNISSSNLLHAHNPCAISMYMIHNIMEGEHKSSIAFDIICNLLSENWACFSYERYFASDQGCQ